jgi:molybdopterin-guanine dinucleotide biosynthesis protein A
VDVSGAIVAGGRSRRLGTDKRLVQVGGRPLLARTVTAIRSMVADLHVVIATDDDRDMVTGVLGADAAAVTVHVDGRPDCGPAAGLEVALEVAERDLVLVVATDHPSLRHEVLDLLVSRAHATGALAVALGGTYGGEPLLAVYRSAALATVRQQLDAGVRRLQDVLAALDPMIIDAAEWRRHDPDGVTLHDVDEPDDLDRFADRTPGGGTTDGTDR